MKLFDLSGRLALVTGSSKGLGFAIAGGLASAGAEIVLNSRNQSALEEARRRSLPMAIAFTPAPST